MTLQERVTRLYEIGLTHGILPEDVDCMLEGEPGLPGVIFVEGMLRSMQEIRKNSNNPKNGFWVNLAFIAPLCLPESSGVITYGLAGGALEGKRVEIGYGKHIQKRVYALMSEFDLDFTQPLELNIDDENFGMLNSVIERAKDFIQGCGRPTN